ncbi:tetratricopeptide repeat protein [Candidatus Liberibacter asiaticus]|nr:tetratricopeptide repeat protein [Candidatus Liberibacter asiaticus]
MMESNNDANSYKGKCKMGKCCYKWIAPLLILMILSLAIWFYLFDGSHEKKKNIVGENFAQALELFNSNKLDDARSSFEKILSQDNKLYNPLSNMYIASILVAKGDTKNAAEIFLKVANDDLAPLAVRYAATLQAASILVDTSSYEEISKILQKLSEPSNPMHQFANEILGISALKFGKVQKAKTIFEELAKDNNSPFGISTRSQMILANIIASDQRNKK